MYIIHMIPSVYNGNYIIVYIDIKSMEVNTVF